MKTGNLGMVETQTVSVETWPGFAASLRALGKELAAGGEFC